MELEQIQSIVNKQNEYFLTGETLDIKFRVNALKKLKQTLLAHESEISDALKSDLGKSEYESYMCEIGLVLSEIGYMIKNAPKFAKAKRVKTPMSQFAAKSYKLPCPYGNVLIMSPWNYPFLLSLDPLVDAIAAGNTAVVKPSAYSPATSSIIQKILSECFDPKFVTVITGGRKENASLLEQKFDFVFFTGSETVGKEVLRHTAEFLTPAILELGGKSPCIVDSTAKLELAAKRIVFGKYLNCGQTCVAPDYILCDKTIKDKLVEELVKQVKLQFGEDPLQNQNYGKIVNEKHFDRLLGLIDNSKVKVGANYSRETLQISPTILDNVTMEDAVMQEEIFGPILPILTYENLEEVYDILNAKPKPLALYFFSENKENINNITTKIRYGGGCINDVVIHLASSELDFGGVGESGMGAYHGKTGFNSFSHFKSIVNKKTWIDPPVRYQPYNNKFFAKLLRFFLH